MSRNKQISRRSFIRHGAAITAGCISLPLLIPTGVLAAPGRPGPNDRIGIGYIGMGRRGLRLLYLPPAGRIVEICDIFRNQADKVAAKTNSRASYDYRKLLEAADIDAVIVSTPDHWHALPSIHACQAGKHVYTEKPLSLTVREGRQMTAAARKYNRVFQCGNLRRSMDKHRHACQMIRSGVLGKIRTITAANYASPWRCGLPEQPVPKDLDWDVWCGQTEPRAFHRDVFMPRAKPGWISFEPYSGGEVTGWGTHGLDQIQWALGMDETGPVEFWPESDRPLVPPTYAEPEDATRGDRLCSEGHAVSYRYANGIEVKMGDGSPAGGLFFGERGKLWLGNNEFKCNPLDLAEQPLPDDSPQLPISDNHFQNWFDCIKSGDRPVADVESAHRATTICHIINITRWLGRKLRWDPEQERFPDDEEANRLLERPQRKPYELPDIA